MGRHHKLLQTCNHEIIDRVQVCTPVTLVRGVEHINIDPILDVSSVMMIESIKRHDNGAEVIVSPETYNLYDDSVIWLRKYSPLDTGKYKVPNTGEQYTVHLKYNHTSFSKHTGYSCPRCRGTGWYVSPLTQGTGVSTVEGPMLVAQEFIKCLLTTPGTDFLDDSYGAGLAGKYSNINYMDKNLSGNIRDAVKTAELQCIQNSNLYTRDLGEILDRAIIDSIEPNLDNSSVSVGITLYTLEGSRARFSVNI